MHENRLPKRVISELLPNREQFFEKWDSMFHENGIHFDFENPAQWKAAQEELLRKIDDSTREHFIQQAQQSNVRIYYRQLNFNLSELNYFNDKFSIATISLIFKARYEILPLNFMPHRNSPNQACSLCNWERKEDVYHFIAQCPILREIRHDCWNRTTLTLEETINILNGEDWSKLNTYLTRSLLYRKRIHNEEF